MKVFKSICEMIIRQRPTIIILLAFFLLITSNARAQNELTNAAFHGDIKTVKALLAEGADVNAKNDEDITALFMACYSGHIDVVKTLLASGADVKVKTSNDKMTALEAAEKGNHSEIVMLLKNDGNEY